MLWHLSFYLQYIIKGHSSDNCLFSPECHCEGKDNRIPLLKEVFEAFPQTPVNIDIKVNNNVLIKKVHEKMCLNETECHGMLKFQKKRGFWSW